MLVDQVGPFLPADSPTCLHIPLLLPTVCQAFGHPSKVKPLYFLAKTDPLKHPLTHMEHNP